MNLILTAAAAATLLVAADPAAPPPLTVDSVFLTLLEEVEVSAREAGIIEELLVREGQAVQEGQLLARIDDTLARTAYDLASIELDKARKLASNELKVTLAKKRHEVALVELQRARDAYERFPKSVSQTELDRLQLLAEQAALEVAQAEFDHETAQLVVLTRENELQAAQHAVQRREVTSPLAGFVVERRRARGEWVEPGQTMLRLVRMDRLRAEGVMPAAQVAGNLMGRPVHLTVKLTADRTERFTGVVSFISPEVQPVNGQVRVWADVENRGLLLRPGMQATMTIAP